jgi:hypothetical protein
VEGRGALTLSRGDHEIPLITTGRKLDTDPATGTPARATNAGSAVEPDIQLGDAPHLMHIQMSRFLPLSRRTWSD